ncbi:MAG: hypothetical protein ACXWQ7_14035 [Bdellovibrio sp.]
MGSVKSNRRVAPRKEVSPIHIAYLTSLDDFAKIARNCAIIEASASGILLLVKREDLMPASLRKVLTLDILIGNRVFMHLEEMNLEISGMITRTKLLGKKGFHIAVDYSDEAPEYWRECLIDLLPRPGELD